MKRCAPSVVVSADISTLSLQQAQSGSERLFSTYQSPYGNLVLQSLVQETPYYSATNNAAGNVALWTAESFALKGLGRVLNGGKTVTTGGNSAGKANTPPSAATTQPVTSNGTANAATYPKLKSDLVQQNWDNIAKQDSRLNSAVNDWKGITPNSRGEVNFGIGSASHSEAERLGKIWVGDGARPVNNPSCVGCLISADGTRLYRPPTQKTNTPAHFNPTGTQANFVIRDANTGKTLTNGHLVIK